MENLDGMSHERICAIVVTFNRKLLLIEGMDALLKQTRPLDAVYIVDNDSTDGTPQLLKKKGYIKDILNAQEKPLESVATLKINRSGRESVETVIHYVRMHKNTGGAGGFYEGIKRAYEQGYDWLWVMDDDVEADRQCLEYLCRYRSESGVVIPVRVNNDLELVELASIKYDLKHPFNMRKFGKLTVKEKFKDLAGLPPAFPVEDMSFEGPLIHRNIVARAGLPMRELFIFGDDTEYSFRIRYNKISRLMMVGKAVVRRKNGGINMPEFSWKTYYFIRNLLWLYKTYGENMGVKYVRPACFIMRKSLAVIIRRQYDCLIVFLYAYLDACLNRFPRRNFQHLSQV